MGDVDLLLGGDLEWPDGTDADRALGLLEDTRALDELLGGDDEETNDEDEVDSDDIL